MKTVLHSVTVLLMDGIIAEINDSLFCWGSPGTLSEGSGLALKTTSTLNRKLYVFFSCFGLCQQYKRGDFSHQNSPR